MEPHTRDIWDGLPESKLELIGGRLVTGNSLAGSLYLLWAILQMLGPRAALPLAPLQDWRAALASAFRAPPLRSLRDWEAWAATVAHAPHVEPLGSRWSWEHHDAWSLLMVGLHQVLREGGDMSLGRSLHRFAQRLGDDAFLPDLQCFRRDRLHRIQTYYYDGPADLVIEIILPGEAATEQRVKRQRYAAGGVPEFWVVDPAARRIEFLRLEAGGYVAAAPDVDGRYRSVGMPGLVCAPGRLWACLDAHQRWDRDEDILAVEPTDTPIGPRSDVPSREGWSWEWRPFAPPVGVGPTPISFEQFIAWCPESKFELLDGKPHIGGWDGTRKTLGLLLMTFGLEEAVKLLRPHDWVAALREEEADRQVDAARRDAWWGTARRAAQMLRKRFGVKRVAVIGDLVRAESLHFWSDITLVAWGLPKKRAELYAALDELSTTPAVEVRVAEDASPRQQEALSNVAVAV